MLRNRGYSNFDIARELGISRLTVASYLDELGKMEKEEFASLVLLLFALVGGAVVLSKIFGKQENKEEDARSK